MTPEEKTGLRVQLKNLLKAQFGPSSSCNIDMRTMIRVEGDTTARFTHDGKCWELRRLRGDFTLTQVS